MSIAKEQILASARAIVGALMSEPDALPLISAAAVAGNCWQENLCQPVTEGPRDHGSDGMLQWRLDRLTALQALPNWQTLETQSQYFKSECKAKFPTLWGQLAEPGARTLANLVANICDMYERPSAAGRVLDRRIGYAQEVMSLFEEAAPQRSPAPVHAPEPAPAPIPSAPATPSPLLQYLEAFGRGVGHGIMESILSHQQSQGITAADIQKVLHAVEAQLDVK